MTDPSLSSYSWRPTDVANIGLSRRRCSQFLSKMACSFVTSEVTASRTIVASIRALYINTHAGEVHHKEDEEDEDSPQRARRGRRFSFCLLRPLRPLCGESPSFVAPKRSGGARRRRLLTKDCRRVDES